MRSEHFVPTNHPRVPSGQPAAGQFIEPPAGQQRKHVAVSTGWWPRSISDGDAHYGERAADGIVTAACGVTFVPQVNPYLHKAVRQHSPADPEHACPDCRAKHPPSTEA